MVKKCKISEKTEVLRELIQKIKYMQERQYNDKR